MAAAAGGVSVGQTHSLPKNSPFLPPASAASTAAASVGENLEFAGVSSVGKRTDLIFHDKGAKKNYWVGLGETKDGIQVLNYDDRREQVVVKHNGIQKVITLRKGARTIASAAAPLPVSVNPMVPVAPVVFGPPAPSEAPLSAPQPTPDVAAPAAATTPTPQETQVKQETEARMLVSDLLEIGMAQRRAYEEAQRKSAEANPPPAPPAEAPKS